MMLGIRNAVALWVCLAAFALVAVLAAERARQNYEAALAAALVDEYSAAVGATQAGREPVPRAGLDTLRGWEP